MQRFIRKTAQIYNIKNNILRETVDQRDMEFLSLNKFRLLNRHLPVNTADI